MTVSPRQQIPFSTIPRIQQVSSTPRPALPVATSLPFLPLKDFIASKFGAQYSPEPPKLSNTRPTLITPISNNQVRSNFEEQHTKQPYGGLQANQAFKISMPVQPTLLTPVKQNTFQQQSLVSVQQQQQQQQRQQQIQQQQFLEQQLRLQQQLQKFQQLKQEQNQLQQQYQIQQQQKLQQQLAQQQQKQISKQQYFSSNQQQVFPAVQNYDVNRFQKQQHQQQQVSTKIVPSVEQQFQIQQSVSLTPQNQQQQQQKQTQKSQIQIIPSQMTMTQTIHGQQSNSNAKSEIGSINVRLPSNLIGLIPSTNIYDSSRNSLELAQRRSDLIFGDMFGGRERKSVFAGVSSYDVPLSSVGRLTNDITQNHLFRQRKF